MNEEKERKDRASEKERKKERKKERIDMHLLNRKENE